MVAIDDMDEENGCASVAPGWHSRGPVAFRGAEALLALPGGEGLPVVDPADLTWLPVPLAAGDVLIYGNSECRR